MASNHVVVDGSNIATEGRAAPSLQQLDGAVRALLAEYRYEHVTVVVDATFGHRIDAKEVPAYEEAVLNGELVTPPAGAIGRGDAFVLQIADRADADVFSNDSFQEFHGSYPWLFDEGRLIGGKPVANVGWVFVLRAPVRGPASRRSMRDARKTTKKASATPLNPMKSPRVEGHEGDQEGDAGRRAHTATVEGAREGSAEGRAKDCCDSGTAAGEVGEEGFVGGCGTCRRRSDDVVATAPSSFRWPSRTDQRSARLPHVRGRSSARFGRRGNR